MPHLRVDPIVAQADDAELIRYPSTEIRVHAGHGDIQVADYRDADRDWPPMHGHPWDEVQVVVEGSVEFRVGGADPIRGGAGTVQFLPSGTPHATRIPEGTARIIQVSIGAPYDAFARDMAALFAQEAPLERFVEIAARHGVRIG
jgi:uncharacterized cupin superfamily protein